LNTFDRLRNLFRSAADVRERRQKPRTGARPGTRILVVDDSPTVVALLRKYLAQNAFVILEAPDAEKGLEIARTEKPDLIFLDIVMPGMNGFAALRALRHDARTADIPVIMISGNAQATELFYAHRIGADDFMRKPFTREDVFARIERRLDANFVLKRRTGTLRVAG
jgi:twitching motility two-component system response regulator PilH